MSDMSDDSQSDDGDKSHEQDCVNGEEKSEKATDVSSTTATDDTEHAQRQIKSSIAKVSSSEYNDGVLGTSVNNCIYMQRRRTSFGPDTAAQLRKAAGMYFFLGREEGGIGSFIVGTSTYSTFVQTTMHNLSIIFFFFCSPRSAPVLE